MKRQLQIAVAGGGAAGLMAAVTAASEGAAVTLYERNDRIGKKLLSTGNGKCNFSNEEMSALHYYGDRERLAAVLAAFDEKSTVSFFEQAGMLVKSKNGYLYPASEQASTVLDIFRLLLRKKQVQLECDTLVTGLLKERDGRIRLKTDKGEKLFDRVILTCGGNAAPKTGSDGNGYRLVQSIRHSVTPVVPALVQLRSDADWLKAVAGVRLSVRLSLYEDKCLLGEESGELQLTDYGISGIVTFQLSRLAAYALREKKKVCAYIDCLPDMEQAQFRRMVEERINRADKKDTVEEFFTGILNKKLMLVLIKLAGLKPGELFGSVAPEKIERFFSLCKSLQIPICAVNPFDQAQVSAGGVPLTEVTKRMESVKMPNIFLAGELLDVDGKCGGYNLQWAWSSGYVAGKSAAEQKEDLT